MLCAGSAQCSGDEAADGLSRRDGRVMVGCCSGSVVGNHKGYLQVLEGSANLELRYFGVRCQRSTRGQGLDVVVPTLGFR